MLVQFWWNRTAEQLQLQEHLGRGYRPVVIDLINKSTSEDPGSSPKPADSGTKPIRLLNKIPVQKAWGPPKWAHLYAYIT